MSFNEAVELALHKFPTVWRSDSMTKYGEKPKQIIFVRELVEKIIAGKIQVTYRKTPKVGTYYVIENRFRQNSSSAKVLIEFYQTDKVDAYNLSDEEAQLAGVETADKIRELFQKWYGSPIPALYRNWFKVKETGAS
ncbi:MAG TPA: ASCH domain-containing protein [Nitrososphaerales archaeon]|nr:ASCH domain-containing protein [Nitrososphaerales archaeon]